MTGEEFLPKFLPALVEHLRAKGWLDKTVFHICDEPSNHNVMAWREASDFVHRHAPELRRMDAIETPHCLDRWRSGFPSSTICRPGRDSTKQAQRQGNELWFYTVGIFQGGSLPNKTVDVPLIESRLLHWLNYRYGLKGYLHWGFNAWTDDPLERAGRAPRRRLARVSEAGRAAQFAPLGADAQRHPGLRMPVAAGRQDRPDARRRSVRAWPTDPAEPARRGDCLAGGAHLHRLHARPRGAVRRPTSGDRRDARPGCVAPRDSADQSAGTLDRVRDCAIDVHGWGEPGTKIKINGSETPVASDGLFLEQLPASAQGEITVEAVGEKGHKSIVRTFELHE